jgi:hypothetical protein
VFVDNVDNLFLDCPHDPQSAWKKAQQQKAWVQFVDNVDNVDNHFSVAGL